MSRSSLALAIGLVCCVLLSSGLGAAAVTGDSAGKAGQFDDDSTLSDDTTEAVTETTDTTDNATDSTDTVSNTPDDTSGTVTETGSKTTDAVSNTTEDTRGTTDSVSDAAENTTDAVAETVGDGGAGASDAENRSEERVGTTLGTASNVSVTPVGDAADAANATENANATGNTNGRAGAAASQGPRGEVPSPDGKTAAVGAGVGAAVAAGAAGRAYVGSTGGNPQTVSGLARTGAPIIRTAPRALLDRAWRLLGAAGYALHSGDPLEHETRAELVAAVEDNPGAYLSELADASDASTSTVRYHLKVLEREGVLTPVKIRGKRRYFPGDEPPDELAAALGEDGVGDVLRALARIGPASVSAVAAELDRDPSTATHHLDRLAEAGFVERERDGRAVTNRLTSTAAAALSPRAGERPDSGAVESTTGD